MNKLLTFLLDSNTITVFDIDGTLAPYEFGALSHCIDNKNNWRYHIENNKPYDKIRSIPRLKEFIQQKSKLSQDKIYICSVSQSFEINQKRQFIIREYPEIPKNNIYFVNSKEDKIKILNKLSEITFDKKRIAIIDDTISTLNMIHNNNPDFITVHVSSFFA